MMGGPSGRNDSGDGGDSDEDWRQVNRSRFDVLRTDGLVTAVVTAVAEVEGVPPTELDPPLYDVVDVDSLARTCASLVANNGKSVDPAEFVYRGLRVRVTGDGYVDVYERIDE